MENAILWVVMPCSSVYVHFHTKTCYRLPYDSVRCLALTTVYLIQRILFASVSVPLLPHLLRFPVSLCSSAFPFTASFHHSQRPSVTSAENTQIFIIIYHTPSITTHLVWLFNRHVSICTMLSSGITYFYCLHPVA
jgi:hypothetical protein